MKRRPHPGVLVAALALLAAVPTALAYNHPCILLTNADLNELNARKNTAPYAAGYALFTAPGESHTKLSYVMRGPFVEVGRNPHVNIGQWRDDMQAIFGLALQWKFTGDQAYAIKARDILLAWANTHTVWSGVEPYLEMGDYAHYFTAGASILRSWSGWTAANTSTVKNYFNTINYPATTTMIPLRSANQGGAHLIGGMCHAVYLDDTAKFNSAVDAFRTNGCTGLRTTQSNGQLGDSGRDHAHAHGELWHYAKLAELAWKAAGVDLFALENNRIRTCAEYWSTYANGGSVPWVKAGTCYGVYGGHDSEGIGPRTPSPESHHLLVGAYVLRKGQSLPQSQTYANSQPDNWKSWAFRRSVDTSTATVPGAITFPSATSLTSGLTRAEVGGATPAGSLSNSGSTWTVTGGGADIWGDAASDSFTYAYKQITGDAVIIARVTSLTNTHASARAGVMIRESLSGNSKMAAMVVKPGTNGGDTTGRGANAYAHYANENSYPRVTIPYWVKIERRGTRVTAFNSSDGTNWTPAKVYDFTMASPYYIGLCVTSHVDGTPATATFTNVALTGAVGALPPAGTYSLRCRSSGLMLDNLGAPTNGDPVGQWQDGSSTNQRWVLSYVSTNVVKLQCVTNGKYLDGAGRTTPADPVTQWDNSSSNNQRWTIIDAGGGFFKLKNVTTGLCLDVGGGPWPNGDVVQQYPEGTSSNQQWQFVAP